MERLKRGLVILSIVASVVSMLAVAYADTITGNQVVVKVDDVTTTYDFDQVKIEVKEGKTKVCICRCLCFRALQILAGQFVDGVIARDDIRILTGWTTDGPEELFVEVMGWSPADLVFVANATDPAYLTIQDAFFFFVQKSTGRAWKVVPSQDLYPKEFFTYRTLVKTKSATEEQTAFFKTALRPQAVANMEALPLIDKFDVRAISFYGEDRVLRIPGVLAVFGVEYDVALKDKGNNLFELIKAVPVN